MAKFGRGEEYQREMILLSGEEAKPLVLAATGSPYFLIVEERGVGVHHIVRNGFDLDWVFDFIKDFTEKNPEFKDELSNKIIELSELL